MKRIVLAALFAVALPAVVGAATAPSPPSTKVTVKLPGDLNFQFRPGVGYQLATAYCLACHSSAYVSTQPVLDTAHWAAEVAKMRTVYGAPIPDAAADAITTYLATAYGTPANGR